MGKLGSLGKLRIDSAFGILAITGSIMFIPVLADLSIFGKTTPFRYFAADSFYYFTVARNFAETGLLSFDQIHPTNGFHPLWQLITALIYKITLMLGQQETVFLAIVLLVSAVSVSLGVVFLGMSFAKSKGRIPTFFILTPVGVYALIILPVWVYSVKFSGYCNPLEGCPPLYGTMWSYMSGVASSIVILLFGIMSLIFSKNSDVPPSRSIWLGLCAALFILARLDHVFIVVGITVFYGLRALKGHERYSFSHLVLFVMSWVIPLLIYMFINKIYAGSIMPVSGALKTTFPYPNFERFSWLISVLSKPFSSDFWLDQFYRIAQLLIPCFFVLVGFLFYFRKIKGAAAFFGRLMRELDDFDCFLLATGVGILALGFYNFFFLTPYHDGHWYFPISILYITLLVTAIIHRFSSENALRKAWKIPLYSLLCLLVFLFLHIAPNYHERYINFYFTEAPRLRDYYRNSSPKIIEYDDGIIAFSTRFPTMSGFGLVLDKEAYTAKRKGQREFVELAMARGFERITSLVYVDYGRTDMNLWKYYGYPLREYDLPLEYKSADNRFGIVKIKIKFPGVKSK